MDGLGGLVLLGPAVDLTAHIVAGLAVVGQADGLVVGVVQVGQGVDLGHEDRVALGRLVLRELLVPEDAALDHVHHVEHGADDGLVGAEAIGTRHREAGRIEGGDDLVFAVDRVGRGQQLPRRLAPHDVFLARRDELIGRVRLAALELAHFQRALVALDIRLHPGGQGRLVEAVAFRDLLGAGI